jgi:hypothetical protein
VTYVPLLPATQGALRRVLSRAAFFSESHAPKGLLALDRLARRYALPEARVKDMLDYNQLLGAPAVDGPIAAHLTWDAGALEDKRIRAHLDAAVFPMAYLSAVEWARRHGPEHLVDAFRGRAARLGDMGHAFTIWCSFRELVPHLTNDAERALFAERFAELVSTQLRPKPQEPPPLETPHDDAKVIRLAIERCGYFAHTAITAAYVLRHRALLDEADKKRAMSVIAGVAQAQAAAVAEWDGDASPPKFEELVRQALDEGPREVHTLTALDAAHVLFASEDEATRRLAMGLVVYIRDLDLRRDPSGERKTS